jgi:hypothetical protein
MPSYFDEAGQAIGSVVAHIHPANAHNWGNIVPTAAPPDGWLMLLPNWMAAGGQMVAAMNAIIAPKHIALTQAELANSADHELYKFQRVLADKARLA